MRLLTILLPVPARTVTPARPFHETVLASPGARPPMVLFDPLLIWIPSSALASTFGGSRKPTTLPIIRFPGGCPVNSRCRAARSPP